MGGHGGEGKCERVGFGVYFVECVILCWVTQSLIEQQGMMIEEKFPSNQLPLPSFPLFFAVVFITSSPVLQPCLPPALRKRNKAKS